MISGDLRIQSALAPVAIFLSGDPSTRACGAAGEAAMSKISAAALLQLADQFDRQKKFRRRRIDKALGRIPKGQDSPFGDFPEDYDRPTPLAPLSARGRLTQTAPVPDLSSSMAAAEARGRSARTMAVAPKSARGHGPYGPHGPNKMAVTLAALRDEVQKQADTLSPRSTSPRSPVARAVPSPKPQVVPSPPKAGAFRRRAIKPSEFRRFYDRGDLPIQVQHTGTQNKIAWKVDIEKLDYHHYLPIFFDGLREKEDPYRFLAVEGVFNLLERGSSKAEGVAARCCFAPAVDGTFCEKSTSH
ncbi:unnamed protein product [Durusdinium trenchii]|uniref:Uncharacterized protein n=1 Tax=Durusdinium trenchii TaxID=1381693 RepID=A0ABP0RP59_9DINO